MIHAIKKLFVNSFALRLGNFSDYLWAVLGTTLINITPNWFVNHAAPEIPKGLESPYKIIAGQYTDEFYFMLLSICLISPVLEELFFRGVLWRLIRKFSDITCAFFVTSIVFAFAHIDPIHIVGVFPIGLYIGYLRLRSNSIFPPILAHVLNNSLVCLTIVAL
jgi:membrane protease YdiL (CAAX protease family)